MPEITLTGLHAFFRQVSQTVSHACMLGGTVEPTPLNRWVLIGLHARQELQLKGTYFSVNGHGHHLEGPDAEAHLFELLEQVRHQSKQWPEAKSLHGLPMAGGLMGCMGYDFYRWCDEGWETDALSANSNWPELILCEFEDWLLLNLESGELTILTAHAGRELEYRALWQESHALKPETTSTQNPVALDAGAMAAYIDTFNASFSQPAFEAAVEQLRQHISSGELYQANLSIRLQKALRIDPYELFENLCRKNPSPFSGFFKWPGGAVVSNSPERLVQVDESGKAQARPIAGTRGRGKTPQEDADIGQTLLSNEKECAEHKMLVDLARNDLGRVCEPGSVQVDELLVLERYSHVTHLVSNVSGQMRRDCTGWDLIRSMFPCGTITGCPKIRCVEILNAVEPVSRGFYTGSMGYLDAVSGAMDWNILIRSLFLTPLNMLDTITTKNNPEAVVYNTAVHIGAGIVHDAVGAHEYRECLRKATASLNELFSLEMNHQVKDCQSSLMPPVKEPAQP